MRPWITRDLEREADRRDRLGADRPALHGDGMKIISVHVREPDRRPTWIQAEGLSEQLHAGYARNARSRRRGAIVLAIVGIVVAVVFVAMVGWWL